MQLLKLLAQASLVVADVGLARFTLTILLLLKQMAGKGNHPAVMKGLGISSKGPRY
jgi:hypothetical protein